MTENNAGFTCTKCLTFTEGAEKHECKFVWSNDEDWVIASTMKEAIKIMAELAGEPVTTYENDYSIDFEVVRPGTIISVGDENGQNPVRKTADEWAASEPKGMLCSRNF